MPYPPYHFGASGFVGLLFRKWLDVPVFVLANVIVDIEVLFGDGWMPHRHWHWHTLLVGAVVGIGWALTAYPFRGLLKKFMRLIGLPYEPGFWKMIISGILGVWLHIVVDAIYHYDVQVFWPSRVRPLHRLLTQGQVKTVCTALFFAAIVTYIIVLVLNWRKKRAKGNR